jgi:subtilisin
MRTLRKAVYWCSLLFAVLAVVTGCQSGDNAALGTPADAAGMARASGQARKIVVFRPGINQAAQEKLVAPTGAVKVKSLAVINAAVVMVSPAGEQALKTAPGVLRVEDDAIATALGKPSKPSPSPSEALPWGVDRIDADRVWDTDRNLVVDSGANAGAGVKVAVIDTGIDLTHPDLQANILRGYNAINPLASANDDNGHGTHVAGIIAGIDNAIGVLGVAPKASLFAVKVLNKKGSGFYSDIIEGIEWSMSNGAQVINMSLGGSVDSQSLHDVIIQANRQGIVIVAAAGNSGPGDNTVDYPGKYSEVIAVSATGSSNAIASFSSRGAEVELAAPGVGIFSTYKGGTYGTLSGTSMATPHVAGAVALVIASGRASSPDAVRTLLRQTADDLGSSGKDNLYGYGLLDAEQAATGVQTGP